MQVKFVSFLFADSEDQNRAEKIINKLVSEGWKIAPPNFRTASEYRVVVMLTKED